MKKQFLCTIIVLLLTGCGETEPGGRSVLTEKVRFVITVPEDTPSGSMVYMAGSFNGWNASDSKFRAVEDGQGRFVIEMDCKPAGESIEYKLTRGSWESEAVEGNGTVPANSVHLFSGTGEEISLTVAGWKDRIQPVSTLDGDFMVLSNFVMPQLGRTRDIIIYLPPDYKTNTGKTFPVLYMQDGQNIFDASSSFSGEWEVDETLQRLFRDGRTDGVIVVGINNDGSSRADEYLPWPIVYGGGEADRYLAFIANTLKPYMDSNFRTKPEREHTGIAGSSFGGFVSFYAAFEYPHVFGKIGAFSPTFWVEDGRILTYLDSKVRTNTMQIYMDIGGKEGNREVQDTQNVYNKLLTMGFSTNEIKMVIDPEAGHNEAAWRARFPGAFVWLFE